MKETTRTTGVFVGAAILSIMLAIAFKPSTPKPPSEFADVGQAFYDEFDALQAKSLKVVSFNDATATSKTFEVELKDGLWRIPSHHNYPADAKDRLAKTAASVVTIRKDAFHTSNKDDYEELGVIDPLEEDATKLKGRGQRLTLKDENGKVLADYIIGKQVKNRPGFYYVRQPSQKSVYISKLNIDLSTKFSDWIETNLLNLGTGQLRDIVVNKYSIDQEKGTIVDTEVNELVRDKAGDPWKLKGLSDDKEELNTSDVNTMISTLEDLRIVGVRPKPAGLSKELKQDGAIKIDPLTMADLQSRGFYFARGGQLVSQEGEVLASCNDGVTYVLRFGEVFAGSETEAETGIGKGTEVSAAEEKNEGEKTEAEAKPGEEKPEEAKKSGLTENRYVFISATFDEEKLGPKPVKPEAPPEPAPAEKKEEEKKEGEEKPASEGEAKPETPAVDPKYEELKKKYDEDLDKYETDQADYDKRKQEGEARAADLNRRFADWFYVISSDSFNKLRMSRSALVKEKTAAPPAEQTPGTPPVVTPEKPAEEKPEEPMPADETPAETTPAEEKPPEEKPAEDKPAEEPKTSEPASENKPAEEKPAEPPSSDEKPAEGTPPATEEKK